MASDGLLARDNGLWGKVKLSFLDHYLPPALIATRSKVQRHFLDLFAGPGRNIDARGTKEEFEGGSIRALKATDGHAPPTSFTHLVAMNLDQEDHDLLTERVRRLEVAGESMVPHARIRLIPGDCNHHTPYAMKKIDHRAYVLVFADPTAPKHFPFSTVQSLRSQGHKSVDLYMLYPSDMALRRLFGNPEANTDVLTRFFGGDGWRAFTDARMTSEQFPELMRKSLAYYCDQLRAQAWAYVRVVREVKRSGAAGLYDMILATNHPAGDRIGAWAADKEATKDQLRLF
jgi:three-Cys-motif partner protein